MGAVGIIVEYNPMHNGHIFHLNEARKIAGDKPIIAVISGNFVQRGELSCLEKYKKALLAIQEGVDVVVELPFFYSTQSAEIFSIGAVKILNELGIDTLVFGSEEGSSEKLIENVKKIINNKVRIDFYVKEFMQTGLSYSNAIVSAYKKSDIELELKPNTILSIEYIKTILVQRYRIKPIAILRKNTGYFDEGEIQNIASASYIRKLICSNQLSKIESLVSTNCFEMLKEVKLISFDMMYDMLYFAIKNEENSLEVIQDMEIGLETRLKKNIKICYNYNEFFKNVITRRYTQSRIQRVLIHILLGVTKEMSEYVKKTLPYIQILGTSQKGRSYLNEIKERTKTPLITNIRNRNSLSGYNRKLYDKSLENDNLFEFMKKERVKNVPIVL